MYVDVGDFVIVINVEKVVIFGAKCDEFCYCYFGYLGGLSKRIVGELFDIKFECVIELVVKGMLLKNTFGCV